MQTLGSRVETFERGQGSIDRLVEDRDGIVHRTNQVIARARGGDLAAEFDAGWLGESAPPHVTDDAPEVRVVDLFSGCGGLTLGIAEACRALDKKLQPVLAMDVDVDALAVYERNFSGCAVSEEPIELVLQPFGSGPPNSKELALIDRVGDIDILVGGPPCQGNSDLNNYTRRNDPKNELYALMARFCEIAQPKHVIIENVPGVVRSRTEVAQRTWNHLRMLGYEVDSGIMAAQEIGVAQRRKRSITLASRSVTPSVAGAQDAVSTMARPLEWAIGDLRVDDRNSPFDSPPNPNCENRRRMEYLHRHGLYDLPDSERPDCHRLKPHTYVSVYGRLRWSEPAPTITTGFGSMGRGRWVHPDQPRTITPHEAARIQGFPDFFSFGDATRTMLHKFIGNAVPPRLGYASGLELLR